MLITLGLLFLLEGLFPFISPGRWRQTFLQLASMTDGQIRFFGLLAIVFGILLLVLRFFLSEA
ncbi:MAG: DUF2065 domain-containing protein [Oxalobacteraceae bacterium]|nr:DUF2065 domain-containing protein [Oxalobacteraceae bacterium]